MKSDQRSDYRIRPSIADDIGEGSFPQLMVVVTDQEASEVEHFSLHRFLTSYHDVYSHRLPPCHRSAQRLGLIRRLIVCDLV